MARRRKGRSAAQTAHSIANLKAYREGKKKAGAAAKSKATRAELKAHDKKMASGVARGKAADTKRAKAKKAAAAEKSKSTRAALKQHDARMATGVARGKAAETKKAKEAAALHETGRKLTPPTPAEKQLLTKAITKAKKDGSYYLDNPPAKKPKPGPSGAPAATEKANAKKAASKAKGAETRRLNKETAMQAAKGRKISETHARKKAEKAEIAKEKRLDAEEDKRAADMERRRKTPGFKRRFGGHY